MALDKQPSTDSITLVTFRLPVGSGAAQVQLVGDFNDWTPQTMAPSNGGGHELTVPLHPGRSYRFHYLLDGERWENDWQADNYVPNLYGGDDSLIDLTPTHTHTHTATAKAGSAATTRKRAARPKTPESA
jgi:1,4-alpha-glucan branching enzyme